MNTFQANQVVASLCQVHVQILKKVDNANYFKLFFYNKLDPFQL